jgi:hypothetical protein
VSVIASAARVTFQDVDDSLIRDLKRDSQTLDRIRDSFSRILAHQTVDVWSFVEELAMRGVKKVCVYRMYEGNLILSPDDTGCRWRIGHHW